LKKKKFLVFDAATIFKKNNVLILQAINCRSMAYYLQSVGSTIKTVIVNNGPRRWLKNKQRYTQHG
jgi:hypothetical protein